MAAVNKVILVGNLGRDPEVRYTQDGKGICNFTLATTDSWKDKNSGERRERTEWHRVVIFGKIAEIMGEILDKGRQVYVEGRLQTRKWTGQDGQDRWTTEVVIDQRGTIIALGPNTRNNDVGNRSDGGYQGYDDRERTPVTPPMDMEDDIPF